VQVGLVANLARPGGNATGINFLNTELVAKRLGLLHDTVPSAVRIAVLVNPGNALLAEATVRDTAETARVLGLQTRVLKASTSREIQAAFATLASEPADAMFVSNDGFFSSRRVQFAILATRYAGRAYRPRVAAYTANRWSSSSNPNRTAIPRRISDALDKSRSFSTRVPHDRLDREPH